MIDLIHSPHRWQILLTMLVLTGLGYYVGAAINHTHAQDALMENVQFYHAMAKGTRCTPDSPSYSEEVEEVEALDSLGDPIYIVNMNNCSIEGVVVYGVIWNNKEYLMAVSRGDRHITISSGTDF